MKIKNLFAVSAALTICIGCTACGEDKSNSSSSSNKAEITLANAALQSPKVNASKPEGDFKGVYIANGIKTGINLHAPEGLTVTDCKTYENSDGTFTCMPECVPTASKPFIISDENSKDNMNFYASSGPGQEEFNKITKESYEEEYLKGVSDYFTDVEITDFETFEIENYPALKAVIKAEYNGEPFEQTQVILDVAEYGCQSGYMYTITYTDYSGKLKDKIQNSIDSIDQCNALTLWRAYKNPDDAAAAMKNGDFNAYGDINKSSKKAVTAATYTYTTKPRSSRFKDVEEFRKKYSARFKKITEYEDENNEVYESSGESTETTVDMEMVKQYRERYGY